MVNQTVATSDVPVGADKVNHTLKVEEDGIPPIQIGAPTSGPEYAAMFYRRSNAVYGTKVTTDYKQNRHSMDSSFTAPLGKAGMYRNHGLNTHIEPDRYMDGTHDWMLKIV